MNEDIKIVRGDTGLYKLNLTDQNGSAIILSDAGQIYFTVKENLEVDKCLISKKIRKGITLGDDNAYHIVIDSEDTNDLKFKTYYYDIQVMVDAHTRKTVKRGNFIVEYEVTCQHCEV